MTPLRAIREHVATALLEVGAVGYSPDQPVRFKSGILSPVYVDNRRLPFHPPQWRVIIDSFQQMIALRGILFHVVAGIEAAGIPHSAALGYAMQLPSVFVRKAVKDHGLKNRVEGGNVAGKKVLLIEDMVTTGSSSLSGVEALRAAGATVEHCLCITSYGFAEAQKAFDAAGVRLHALAPFADMVVEACRIGQFDQSALTVLEDWTRDPHGWQPGQSLLSAPESEESDR